MTRSKPQIEQGHIITTSTVQRIRDEVIRYANRKGETEGEFARRLNSTPENIESYVYGSEESGGTSEDALKSFEGLDKSLHDPAKVELIECMGVKVYADPQPDGHPPSASECERINRRFGITTPSSGN